MAATLCCQVDESMPVPLPVISPTEIPVSAEQTAAALLVTTSDKARELGLTPLIRVQTAVLAAAAAAAALPAAPRPWQPLDVFTVAVGVAAAALLHAAAETALANAAPLRALERRP